MHVRVLSERLEYLYGVIPTTPFFYAPVAKHLSGIVERENRNGKVTAPNKAHATKILYEYLVDQKQTLRDRSPFGGGEASGAAYVLKKISAGLHYFHYRTTPESPERDDLDL